MPSKQTARAYATHADDAPGYWMIGVLWRVLATGIQTGGAMCLLDQVCSRGSGPARHAHPQEEALYVVSGTVSFSAGGTDLVAGPGSLVTVPRFTEHSFMVDEDAVLINFYFPAGFEMWLMGSAVPAQRDELPPADTPFPPMELTKALSDDYGGLPLTKERSTTANPDAPVAPAVNSRRTAEAIWLDHGCWSVLADAASTGGSYSVFEVEHSLGLVDEPHVSDSADVAIYVLDGELDVLLDSDAEPLRAGSFAFAPRGTVQAIRVTSGTARFLAIHTMPGFERLLRASGKRAPAPVLPLPEQPRHERGPNRVAQLNAELGLRRVHIPAGFVADES